jgi:hypothetical protein
VHHRRQLRDLIVCSNKHTIYRPKSNSIFEVKTRDCWIDGDNNNNNNSIIHKLVSIANISTTWALHLLPWILGMEIKDGRGGGIFYIGRIVDHFLQDQVD